MPSLLQRFDTGSARQFDGAEVNVMKLTQIVLALVVAWGGAGVAHAAAIVYSADATATLSITGISLTPVPSDIFNY